LAFGLTIAGQEPPVFPSGAELVAVDVAVLDSQGRPVLGLRPEDFTLTVDGKPRRVVSAEFVAAPAANSPEPPPAGFSTNVGAPRGRLVILAVDQGNIRPGGVRPIAAAAEALYRGLQPHDLLGLATFPPPGPSVEPTADRGRIRDALKKVVGRGRSGRGRLGLSEALAFEDRDASVWEQVVVRECPLGMDDRQRDVCIADLESEARGLAITARADSHNSLRSIGALLDGLKTIDGPKTVIVVSEALLGDDTGYLRSLATEAAAAQVTLFGIRLDTGGPDVTSASPGFSDFADRAISGAGLETLVAMARGTVLRAAGGSEALFERIVREMSGHYLLGFEPEPTDRDGSSHDVKVAVARRGATVRSRRVVRFPSPEADDAEAVLRSVLGSPFLATELPIRAAAYSLPEPDGSKVRVLIAAELGDGSGPVPDPAATFTIRDARDKVVAGGKGGTFLAPEDGGTTGYLFTVSLDPGRYALKLAARDRRGRRGSVEHAFTAGVAAVGRVSVGDLLLARLADGARLWPVLDPRSAGEALAAHLEIAVPDPKRLQETAVRFEVAETDASAPLFSVPGTLIGNDPGRRTARALLPLGVLPPGAYVSRAVVTVAGASATARRAFKVVPARGRKAVPLAALAVPRPPFRVADALSADVVGHFLERVVEIAGRPPAAARPAWENAGSGRFDAALEAIGSEGGLHAAFLRGLALLSRGQPAAAAGQFRHAIEPSPELLPAAFFLGVCAAAEGKDREAIGAWQTALVGETGSPALYHLLADALLRVDDGAGAVDILREAGGRWSEDDRLAARLGIALAALGQRAEAWQLLARVLDRGSRDADALFVALHLLFEAHASGTAAPEDLDRLARYARAYAAAEGPQKELVALWERYLRRGSP
jgi:VWFA-related protein